MYQRTGFIVVRLKSGEARPHIPCQLDYVMGAARPANFIDDRKIDNVLNKYGSGFRTVGVFHARNSLKSQGERNRDFDPFEEQLGLSRTYRIQLGDPKRASDVVQALRALDIVERAGPQQLTILSEQAAGFSRNFAAEVWEPQKRVRSAQALALEPGDASVTVAVVDTGIALGHPEFRGRLLSGYDTVDLGIGQLNEELILIGDSRGRDFSPEDEVGHGSHVAGIIGAKGIHIAQGLGGLAHVEPVRVLAAATMANSRKRIGVGAVEDIDAGIKLSIDAGADVINLSLGTPASSLDPNAAIPHSEVVKYAMHYHCVLVAAAGNSGQEEKFFPAALPEVIAVGSVEPDGERASYSTYGEHIALSAPGSNIVSAGAERYKLSTGTSHAAPFVSGAVALLISRARRHGITMTAPLAKQLLCQSATPLRSPKSETGAGLLNMEAALQALDNYVGSGSQLKIVPQGRS
jgi:subtilisin family serine protease